MAHITINQYLQQVTLLPRYWSCHEVMGVRAVSLCWRFPPAGLRSHRQPRGFVLRRVAVLQTPARCQPPTSGEALRTQVDAQRSALPGNGFISVCVCLCVFQLASPEEKCQQLLEPPYDEMVAAHLRSVYQVNWRIHVLTIDYFYMSNKCCLFCFLYNSYSQPVV